MAADEYALDPRSPSTKYAHMAETEVSMATPAAAPPVTHELNGERNEKPVELPAAAPSAPSTAGGAQAVELESPLSSPRGTTTPTA